LSLILILLGLLILNREFFNSILIKNQWRAFSLAAITLIFLVILFVSTDPVREIGTIPMLMCVIVWCIIKVKLIIFDSTKICYVETSNLIGESASRPKYPGEWASRPNYYKYPDEYHSHAISEMLQLFPTSPSQQTKLEGLRWYFYPQFYTGQLKAVKVRHTISPIEDYSSLDELKTAWEKVNEIIYNLYKIEYQSPMNVPLAIRDVKEPLMVVSNEVLYKSHTLLDGSLTGVELESQSLIVMLTILWFKIMTGFMVYGVKFYSDPNFRLLLRTFQEFYSGKSPMDSKDILFMIYVHLINRFPHQKKFLTKEHLIWLCKIFAPRPWGKSL
jgi:hypothetical protein